MKYLKKEGTWDWTKIVAIMVGLMLLPMIGLIYNKMDTAIAENKKADIALDAKKVDREVMIQYLEVQKMQLKLQEQQTGFLKEKLEKQEAKETKLLEAVQDMNINMVIIQEQLKKD